MNVSKLNRTLRSLEALKNNINRYVFALSISILLAACTGGTGSAGNSSVLGGDGDPFIEDATLQGMADALGFVTPIAYIKRPLPVVEEMDDTIDWRDLDAFEPGAALFIRAGAALSASEFNITDRQYPAGQYDVKDITVSPDGEKLLFAMHEPEDDPEEPEHTWNIWEYDLLTDTLTAITSDGIDPDQNGHDVNPIYLADGNIMFSSSRQQANRQLLPDEGKISFSGQTEAGANNRDEIEPAFNLHVIDSDDVITQLTFNQSHDFSPIVQSNGKILYIRWDNIDGTDRTILYEMNPDGTEPALMYGFHSLGNVEDNGIGFLSRLRVSSDDKVLAITQELPNELTTLGGDIVIVDIDNFIDQNTPTAANIGLTTQAITSESPAGVMVDDGLSPAGRYLSAWPLLDGTDRLLVSWSNCRATSPANPNAVITACAIAPAGSIAANPAFEVWMYSPADNTQLPIVRVNNGEMISDIIAMEPRTLTTPLPANIDTALASESQAKGILNIRSIYDMDGIDIATGGIATVADPSVTDPDTNAAKFLRLVKAVSIPPDEVYEINNTAFGVSRDQLMREIIGYVPIEPDGSVQAVVPANVPFMISVVDRDGKRINIENPNNSSRHNNWLSLAPGSTLDCRGCHANNSTAPHGRIDAQPASVHAGASLSLPYPNTEPALFAPNGGETMAEIYSFHNGTRELTVNPSYTDDWTDDSGSLVKAAPFAFDYANLDASLALPTTEGCDPASSLACRVIINYEQHIQPLWDLPRPSVADPSMTCTGCHTTNGNTQVPAGQLDLTNAPSSIVPDHFTSYRELLRQSDELVDDGGNIRIRTWECNQIDVDTGDAIPDPAGGFLRRTVAASEIFDGLANVPPSMNESGASFGASRFFFNCLTQDNLANESNDLICRSFVGDAIPAEFVAPPNECIDIGTSLSNEAVVNHNGLLSPDELRLVAEWLDIGAQYYNNPFDAPED